MPPHGLQHTRLLCPPLSPEVCSNSCPLSQWCFLTISSSAASFSFCLQSFPISGSFPHGQLPRNLSELDLDLELGGPLGMIHRVAESRTRLSDFTFTFHFHALEKEMAAHQVPPSLGFSRQEHWSGLPFPSMGSHIYGVAQSRTRLKRLSSSSSSWVWSRPDRGQEVRTKDHVGHVGIWHMDEHTLGALIKHVIGGLELSASHSFSILTFWERRGAGVQLPNRQWFNQSSPCKEASVKNLNGGFWRASSLVNCGGFRRAWEQRGCGLFGPSHTSCSLSLFHLIVPDLHPLK